jgi:hemerythrin-like domain-containing protein
MPVQIGRRESDFTNPLGLLADCHRRIERFLGVLLTLSTTRQGGTLATGEAASLRAALDYFRDAAPRHTADEEESLFPRLRAAGALASLDALEADHQVSAAAHEEVDTLGRAWLDAGSLPPDAAGRMADLLRQLAGTYERHIAIEDTEIFPSASRVLRREQIAAVGREMENRRIGTRTER